MRATGRIVKVSSARSGGRVSGVAATAALAMSILAGCTGGADVGPNVHDSAQQQPSPQPGDSNFVPAQEDACDFLIGVDASDFEAYTGADLSSFVNVPNATESLEPPLDTLVSRGGIVCELVDEFARETITFAWNPIGESMRDDVIESIAAEGLTITDTEGGTELRIDEGDPALHLVTNEGWYFSTENRGAEFMRNNIEG